MRLRPSGKSVLLALALMLFCSCGRQDKKEAPPGPKPAEQAKTGTPMAADASSPTMVAGREVYEKYCLVCHQVNGGGVSGLNPPLKGTEYVLGDKARLIAILLHGSNEGLMIDGRSYTNAMPGFAHLSNQEIAHVASYIRNSFGNAAETVTVDEVAKIREIQE